MMKLAAKLTNGQTHNDGTHNDGTQCDGTHSDGTHSDGTHLLDATFDPVVNEADELIRIL